MLPASYQVPAAIALLIGGIISCFFGYRLFRTVLTIFGFILGALTASSIFGVSDTGPMVAAAIIGGLAGAALTQIGNVGPSLGQNYIVDSFMVVVTGGVGKLAGSIP